MLILSYIRIENEKLNNTTLVLLNPTGIRHVFYIHQRKRLQYVGNDSVGERCDSETTKSITHYELQIYHSCKQMLMC